jgi:hypothetical protein
MTGGLLPGSPVAFELALPYEQGAVYVGVVQASFNWKESSDD